MHLRYPIKKQQVELRSVNTSESMERMKPWRRSPLHLAVSSALLRPIYQREKRENNSHYPWPHTVRQSQIVPKNSIFRKFKIVNSKFCAWIFLNREINWVIWNVILCKYIINNNWKLGNFDNIWLFTLIVNSFRPKNNFKKVS